MKNFLKISIFRLFLSKKGKICRYDVYKFTQSLKLSSERPKLREGVADAFWVEGFPLATKRNPKKTRVVIYYEINFSPYSLSHTSGPKKLVGWTALCYSLISMLF